MGCEKKEICPTEFELKIYNEVLEQFLLSTKENAHIYKSFENARIPQLREQLAEKIKNIEEGIIYSIAEKYNLSFDKVAQIYLKVDFFKNT
ncbi:MAG: hypothetical protein XD50_1019 [Clostridia bacterium 41_269]|nr:MAG: hypothetical protein XD50_1019 [Clostridia bacterium 41_269]